MKTTTRFATFALLTLAAAPSAFADVPPPVDCTGMQAGAGCVLPMGDAGICVEQNGALACVTACDPTSGSGCCDLATATCCGPSAQNGVCKSVPGGYACDSTDAQACTGKAQGASCTTEAGETGSCQRVGDSNCSFGTCKPTAGTTASSTSGTTSGTGGATTASTTNGTTSGTGGATTGSTTSGAAGGTSGGPGQAGSGCSIEGLPARAPLGMGLFVAALGATALRRRRSPA